MLSSWLVWALLVLTGVMFVLVAAEAAWPTSGCICRTPEWMPISDHGRAVIMRVVIGVAALVVAALLGSAIAASAATPAPTQPPAPRSSTHASSSPPVGGEPGRSTSSALNPLVPLDAITPIVSTVGWKETAC